MKLYSRFTKINGKWNQHAILKYKIIYYDLREREKDYRNLLTIYIQIFGSTFLSTHQWMARSG